jgi:hypothetical protein
MWEKVFLVLKIFLNEKFQILIAFALSILIPSIPEVALGILIFGGFFYFLQFKFIDKYSSILLFLFFLLKIVDLFSNPQYVFKNLAESSVALLVYFGWKFYFAKLQRIYYFVSISLMFTILVAFFQIWAAPKNELTTWNLNGEGELAKVEFLQGYDRYTPTNFRTAYIVKPLGYQGSGEIEFELTIRSEKSFEINFAMIHPSLPEGRIDKKCLVETVWSRCSIRARLGYRQLTVVGLGGFDTWKGGSPPIEIKNEYLLTLVQPTILEKLHFLPRISGWSFNPNAFAALIVVTCLLAIIVSKQWWLSALTIILSLFGIMVSGSRSAFIAIAAGYLTFLVMRSRLYKIAPFLALIAMSGIVIFQLALIRGTIEPHAAQPQAEMRSLNMVDKDTTRTRLEIWRLASKAWLENPQTFIFGTGDLTKAMKSKLDARAIGFGLTDESITHAHNLWLQTAGQNGLLGFLLMLGLWVLIIWQAWKARDAGSLALMIAIFVINSVDYLFYYAPIHLCFWMAALGFKGKMIDKTVKDKVTFPF